MVPTSHILTRAFTPPLMAGSMREKRELVPTKLPGVEKEEEAGAGRGKHPTETLGCHMSLWGHW